jgi:hypothetical protein
MATNEAKTMIRQYQMTDAFTNELIRPGTEVVAMIISAATITYDNTLKFAGNGSFDHFKISSLPVRGVWDGVRVLAEVNEYVDKINAAGLPFVRGEQRFEDIQTALMESPNRHYSNHRKASSSSFNHALFVMRADTFNLLQNINGMQSRVAMRTPEIDAATMKSTFAQLSLRLDAIDGQQVGGNGQYENTEPLAVQLRAEMKNLISDMCFMHRSDVSEHQYAANLLSGKNLSRFADGFGYVLQNAAYTIMDDIERYKALPEQYSSIQRAFYDTAFIGDAMDVLGKSLGPSRRVDSEVALSNLQLSKEVLFREVDSMTRATGKDSSQEAVALTKEIADLKRELAQAVRSHANIKSGPVQGI